MLTETGCRNRRQRLWNAVPQECDWLLIADPRHVQYLANFWIHPLSFSQGERGLLLLERSGATTLLVDNFALRSAAAPPCVDETCTEAWYDHRHSVVNRDHALEQALSRVAVRLRGRAGLAEGEWLGIRSAALLTAAGARILNDTAESLSLGTILRGLRRQKDPDEIALLRTCMEATAAGQQRCREVLRPGSTEWELYRAVQDAVNATLGFPSLVYGDFRATTRAVPKAGGLPTHAVLQAGDLFILDYSVVIGGYRSDFTNTLGVGNASADQQELMAVCLAAMQSGERALRGGAAARDVFAATAQPFRAAGHDLLHHAGHGIGLAHPEPPILVPESSDTLQAGDVVTLEPGVYVAGVGGIRIERNYLITDTGYERLSQHEIAL